MKPKLKILPKQQVKRQHRRRKKKRKKVQKLRMSYEEKM